jgi:hypothetical protein
MLNLSAAQMQQFDRQARLRYERAVDRHLDASFPARWSAVDEASRLAFVRHVVDRASTYGMVSERDQALYAGVALVLGPDFDEDEGLPWAHEVLVDPFIVSPALRADLLHERAVAHVSAAPAAA